MMTRHRLPMFALALLFTGLFTWASLDSQAASGKKRGSGSRAAVATAEPASSGTPAVGDQAPNVALTSTLGEPVDLSKTFAAGKTVLVVLRGYPGYQCGICSRVANGFIQAAPQFQTAGFQVVMVYPGAEAGLGEKADEFLDGKQLPEPITMVLDPDFQLVNAYGIRWDAPNETAYPSTFVVAEGGAIEWSKISKTHGGRASAKQVLKAIGG